MNEISAFTFVTIEEIAQALNISRNTAYRLVRTNEIRSLKIGSHYRVPLTAVDEYIARKTGLPIPEQH